MKCRPEVTFFFQSLNSVGCSVQDRSIDRLSARTQPVSAGLIERECSWEWKCNCDDNQQPVMINRVINLKLIKPIILNHDNVKSTRLTSVDWISIIYRTTFMDKREQKNFSYELITKTSQINNTMSSIYLLRNWEINTNLSWWTFESIDHKNYSVILKITHTKTTHPSLSTIQNIINHNNSYKKNKTIEYEHRTWND